jgi:hypothetical protein
VFGLKWLYYKIYARDVDDWYYKLLNEIVKPFTQKFDSQIEKIFFFHYVEDYRAEPNCEHKLNVGERVRYIRFRFRADDKLCGSLENNLLSLVSNSSTVIEKEKCEYCVDADLGNRFGLQRTELAVNYLDAFARMVLSLLTENNLLEDSDKPYSLIHLMHNMIGSPIQVACANPNCREINPVETLILFQCRRCSGVTSF